MRARTIVLTLAAAAALLQALTTPGQTSGFAAQPGAGNPLAGKPLVLFRESFAEFLKRKGMFQGPPGASAKMPPLGVWAYSCQVGSPVCKQALYEMRPLSAGEAKTDAAGRGGLPGRPAKTLPRATGLQKAPRAG